MERRLDVIMPAATPAPVAADADSRIRLPRGLTAPDKLPIASRRQSWHATILTISPMPALPPMLRRRAVDRSLSRPLSAAARIAMITLRVIAADEITPAHSQRRPENAARFPRRIPLGYRASPLTESRRWPGAYHIAQGRARHDALVAMLSALD